MKWKKMIEVLICNYEDEIKKKKEFGERAITNHNPAAERMWRYKREGLERAVRDLKIIIKNKTHLTNS